MTIDVVLYLFLHTNKIIISCYIEILTQVYKSNKICHNFMMESRESKEIIF